MIIPRIGEPEWAPLFDSAAGWEPTDAPMVVVVPHPDDETLAAGGLIAAQCKRGVDVAVVAVTDGENAYAQNEGLAEVRRNEQRCALARLGVPPEKTVRLGFADSNVTGQEGALLERLRPLIQAETQVVAPWCGDFHPDHEACGRAAGIAARDANARLVSYFFWTWHRGSVETLGGLRLCRFALTRELMAAKTEALKCHASQLRHEPEPEILPDNLLWPARMPFEVFAV